MSLERTPDPANFAGLEDTQSLNAIRRVLAAAHRAGADPIEDLREHLFDGARSVGLIAEALDPPRGILAGFGDARRLLEDPAGIEVHRAMRMRAKRDLGTEQPDAERRRAALLAFGMAIAAGLAHHGNLETRANRDTVEDLLLVLCGAESPWIAALGTRALEQLARIPDERNGANPGKRTA